MRVLRTGGGSPPSWALHYLKQIPGVELIVGDCDPLSVAFFSIADEHVVIPMARDEAFVETMLNVCRDKKVDILIPAVDEELVKLAQHKSDFLKAGTVLLLSEPETLEKCFDKWLFHKTLEELNLAAPKSWLKPDDIEGDYPYILKPRSGRGSAGVYKLEDKEDLNYALRKSTDYIIQECIEGKEYTVDCLSDLNGRFIYGAPRERMATESGISRVGKTVEDKEALENIEHLLNHLKIIGPSNVQFFRSNKGEFFFLEINPRLSGGGALTQGAGIPFMQDVLAIAKGETVPTRRVKPDVIMLREWREVFIDAPGK